MHRCHYCGKILHELPFKSRRCGHSFCSDHHLPENHQCSRHHHLDHRPHRRTCDNCGHELTGLPYKCHRCGKALCDHCQLPENHGCVVAHIDPSPVRPDRPSGERIGNSGINTNILRRYWKLFRNNVTLKNFTIFSILLMLVGIFSSFYPENNYQPLFQSALEIGIVCFFLAYFLYAVKCWGADHKVGGILMVTIQYLPIFWRHRKSRIWPRIFSYIS